MHQRKVCKVWLDSKGDKEVIQGGLARTRYDFCFDGFGFYFLGHEMQRMWFAF